jgi:hypothetical protein
MYNRALENDYIQSLEDMLILRPNLERRLVPTDDAGLKEVAAEINRLRGVNVDKVRNKLLDGTYLTTLRNDFITGKAWIGIVATNITSHAQMQKTKTFLDPNKIAQLSDFERMIIGNGRVVLPHNTVKINGIDRLSLSGSKTADGKNKYISDRLAGYGTSVLDVAKDRFIMDIIYSDLLIGPTMFLERIGAGEYVSKFINQPIIREYISYLERNGVRGLFSMKNVDEVKQMFPTGPKAISDVDIDVNNLDANIEGYAKGTLTAEQNAEQHKILSEFLKYAKMAQYSFKLTQAINYDTSKSRNSDSFSRKQTKTGIAQQKNIFCCAEDILNASFVGNQRDLIDYMMSAMGEVIKTEQDDFRIITDSVLTPYEEVDYMKDEDFERIASKLKASFIDYIIQTKSNLNEELAALTLGENSVAKQLEEAKKKYPDVRILNDLQVVTSDRQGGAQSVKLRVKISDPVDENVYTEMMRELNDADPKLFNNIVKIALIQGTYDSSISIKNIIPPESYSAVVKPIIDSLAATPDIELFSKGAFQKNNWNDDAIVPVANVTFKVDDNAIPSQDQYGNEYYRYISPSFTPIQGLGISNDLDRRIMLLSPKYNASDAQYEFLKIRRITRVKETKELIDVETGMSVSDAAIYNRRKSGDMSVDDVYGYQKVRDGAGNPVMTGDGRYIYKLTNLWGDGNRAVEHYSDSRRSIYNNATVQIDNEISDSDIINFFGGVPKSEEEVVPSQPMEQAPATVSGVAKNFDRKNIFTVTPQPGVSDNKAKAKASIATQYIGFGEGIVGRDGKRSTTQLYREQAGNLANTGNYSSSDVIFVSIPGLRGDAAIAKREQDKTIKEAVKAVEAGATILTDNKAYIESSNYNTGEQRLYQNMEAKGYTYSEITVDGQVIGTWSKETQKAPVSTTGLSTASGKVTLNDGKEYNISDINAALLESIGYTPKQIGKLLRSINGSEIDDVLKNKLDKGCKKQ